MKIGVFLNGNVKTFDDPVRSEVRWALNLGQVLKWAGKDVIFINNGCAHLEVLNNIPVISYDDPLRRTLNILLNLPWNFKNEPCTSIAGKAKGIHFNFTLNTKSTICSHSVAYPYKNTKLNSTGLHRVLFLPYPSPIQEFKKQQGEKPNKKWVWSSRWSFGQGAWENTLQATLSGVKLAARAINNVEIVVIESENARFNRSMLNNTFNVTILRDPVYSRNCEMLSECELSLRTPILFGNQLESVALGSCPMVFDDVVDQERGVLTERARELNLLLNPDVDAKQICDQLIQLSTDNDLRKMAVMSYQDYLRDHEWDKVLKLFQHEVE